MTILGVAAGRDHAVLWADTAVTGSAGPAGHACKLTINPMAQAIGVGAGMMSLLREADRAVFEGESIEMILVSVAAALRSAAMRMAGGRRVPPMAEWFARNIYAVAGWSSAEERVVAYEFLPAEFFEPQRLALLTVPEVVVPFFGSPLSLEEVHDAAARQAALLREAASPVGQLTVGTLTADGIVALRPEAIRQIAPASCPKADAEQSPPVILQVNRQAKAA